MSPQETKQSGGERLMQMARGAGRGFGSLTTGSIPGINHKRNHLCYYKEGV